MSEIQAQEPPVTEDGPTDELAQDTNHEPEAVDDEIHQTGESEHTASSILKALLLNLEGVAHMGKSEIEAVLAQARTQFEAL